MTHRVILLDGKEGAIGEEELLRLTKYALADVVEALDCKETANKISMLKYSSYELTGLICAEIERLKGRLKKAAVVYRHQQREISKLRQQTSIGGTR